MKIISTHSQKPTAHPFSTVTNRFWLSVFTAFLLLVANSSMKAQTSVVVPDDNQGTSFIGPYANAGRTLQLLIDNTLLTSLNGKHIKSISFRLPASTATSWPTTDLTYNNYEVYLSDSVEPADRQLVFANNVVGTQTQVRTGPLVIPAGALTVGSNPNDFSFQINFDQTWLYEGTNLLIEIRHSGSGISSRTVHAAGTSAPGYGTLYSACWQSTASVLQGNFSYVQITAEESLGTSTVTIDSELQIFPNPVRDMIQIKSNLQIASYEIYNVNGQIITSNLMRLNNSKIDASQLPKGIYLLKLTDTKGNTQISKFIKN